MSDDGLSLEDLMGQLEEVQAEVSAKKLSERNCVEILQTLIRSGLLPGLMYTLDGKEYVTPKQLRLEILTISSLAPCRTHVQLFSILSICVEMQRATCNWLFAIRSLDWNPNSKIGCSCMSRQAAKLFIAFLDRNFYG